MPLYEYHCPTCGNNFERLQAMSAQGSDCRCANSRRVGPFLSSRPRHGRP